MHSISKPILMAAAVLMLAGAAPQPAQSGIKCDGPYQITHYGRIATPYCEDAYLAYVAGADPYTIRRNPNAKDNACLRVGHDPRVQSICKGLGSDAFKR